MFSKGSQNSSNQISVHEEGAKSTKAESTTIAATSQPSSVSEQILPTPVAPTAIVTCATPNQEAKAKSPERPLNDVGKESPVQEYVIDIR